MGNEFVIKNGYISQGTSYITNEGKLGIGTLSPTSSLDIKGIDSSSSNYGLIVQNSSNRNILSTRNDNFVFVGDNAVSSYLWVNGPSGQFGFSNENSNPYLYLNSTLVNNKFFISNGFSGSNVFGQINTNNGNWLIGSPNTSVYTAILTDTKLILQGVDSSSSNYSLKVQNSGGTDNLVVRNDGNVGIGTFTPTEKLDVSGKTKTINFQMTSGGTEDYIMTSDSQGNGSWTPSYNLSTKDYGSFYDTTTQTGGNGTIQSFQLNSSGSTKGISITDLTGITVTHTGIYNIQFSSQIYDGGGTAHDVYIWLRKNGLDIPNSNSRVEVGNNNNYIVAAWNFVEEFNANDVINLMWYSESNTISILYDAAPTAGPEIPSLILTITQI